jgi:16S rRNA (cytidine1402-2'-O)-methyltransferase
VKGAFYIVSTPIGNLEDITLRALRILSEVDIIAAEDTRHALKLLNHHGIQKPLVSYWKERECERSDEIISRLHGGQSVALISDSGTPGICDPGAIVIKKAIQEDIQVISIPGPSALVAALSVSGLPAEHFTFWGFLPARKNQRKKIFSDLQFEEKTLIFYEAPHRIMASLNDMVEFFGERHAALVKEITKMHEQVLRGNIAQIIEEVRRSVIAGEYVVIVEGWTRAPARVTDDALTELRSYMRKGIGRKEAVRKTAEKYGISKQQLYKKSLDAVFEDSDETP